MSMARKKALGKGLGALLTKPPSIPLANADAPPEDLTKRRDVRFIPIDRIVPNPRQPRQFFRKEQLEELAASISAVGVLQPILVIPDKKDSTKFVLLAGERRMRAAQLANLKEIPAQITEATDEEMLEIAIVENVQREDLNPVEEAKAYRSLIDQFGWTQEQIAQRIGKNRTTIANALRLLKLGDEALKDLEAGRLTAGHARAILSLDDSFYRQRLRQEIVDRGISVREAEKLATKFQTSPARTGKAADKSGKNSSKQQALDTVALEDRLLVHLGCRVRVVSRDQKSGVVEIPFRDPDELQRFLEAIGLPD
ncbi:ParB/RepB/Spo0J family partition protein [bacterium]|nr:ParB/RepB/Spo0J family partition protein [bacterium]